jgi:3-oxoacyl-[acyl-carrier protein] reductase
MTQVVVVSGGSKGLGQAFVETLLERGDRVATFSRSETPFIREARERFGRARFLWKELDITDFAGLGTFVREAHDAFGRIDALVNNAGIAVDGVLTLMKPEDIHRVLTVNLEASLLLAQECAKPMLVRKGGAIVNVSSIIGSRGYAGLAAYSATKAGMDGMTRALARELGGREIRVNSIAPGYLETEMSSTLGDKQRDQIIRRTPLGRLGTVKDVTGVLKFLLSDDARFITGQTFIVDGGITC